MDGIAPYPLGHGTSWGISGLHVHSSLNTVPPAGRQAWPSQSLQRRTEPEHPSGRPCPAERRWTWTLARVSRHLCGADTPPPAHHLHLGGRVLACTLGSRPQDGGDSSNVRRCSKLLATAGHDRYPPES